MLVCHYVYFKKGAVKYEKRFLVNEYQDATHEEEDLQVNHPLEFEITHNSSVKDLQYFFIYDEAVENCVTANGTETYQPKGREVVFSADLYRKYFEPDYVNNTRPEYIGETFTMSLREQGESEALVVLDDMILAGVYYEPIFMTPREIMIVPVYICPKTKQRIFMLMGWAWEK